ncbi:hypothetical protein L208DRAFT_1288457, partial [Tricholoma matsutake]
WDTMKAQVMAKIDMILKPATISYDNYNVQFAIPHYSPQLMPLDGSEKYTYMVKYALKAKSSPSAKIVIEAKVTEKQKSDQKGKENIIEISDSKESDSESRRKKRKKCRRGSKVSVSAHILPGNKAMNNQMGLLWAWWACPTPGGRCGSEHCFIQANDDGHFLLGFHELESWAMWLFLGVDSLPDISLH